MCCAGEVNADAAIGVPVPVASVKASSSMKVAGKGNVSVHVEGETDCSCSVKWSTSGVMRSGSLSLSAGLKKKRKGKVDVRTERSEEDAVAARSSHAERMKKQGNYIVQHEEEVSNGRKCAFLVVACKVNGVTKAKTTLSCFGKGKAQRAVDSDDESGEEQECLPGARAHVPYEADAGSALDLVDSNFLASLTEDGTGTAAVASASSGDRSHVDVDANPAAATETESLERAERRPVDETPSIFRASEEQIADAIREIGATNGRKGDKMICLLMRGHSRFCISRRGGEVTGEDNGVGGKATSVAHSTAYSRRQIFAAILPWYLTERRGGRDVTIAQVRAEIGRIVRREDVEEPTDTYPSTLAPVPSVAPGHCIESP